MANFTFFRNPHGVMDAEKKGLRSQLEDLLLSWRKSPKNPKTLRAGGDGFEAATKSIPRDEDAMRATAKVLLEQVRFYLVGST